MNQKGDEVQAVKTTFTIVRALRELDGAGVSELANHLEMPVSTVYNHLNTLEQCQYVVKRGETYQLGYRFLEDGGRVRRHSDLFNIATPTIDKLAQETGDKVNLVVQDHGLSAHLCIAKGEHAIETDIHVGIRLHIHSSVGGKAMLAHLPRERVEAIIDQWGLPQHTENTITSREDLYEELESIRERGVAFDREERSQGLHGVAVPIPGTEERPVAAVSVTGPKSRIKAERFETALPEQVLDAVETIRVQLRYL